jgi:hypothetical protein
MSMLLDWGGTMKEYNSSPTESRADARAIMEDWRSVGDDIRTVIKICESEKRAL